MFRVGMWQVQDWVSRFIEPAALGCQLREMQVWRKGRYRYSGSVMAMRLVGPGTIVGGLA